MRAIINVLLLVTFVNYFAAGYTVLDKIKDDPDLSQVREQATK